MPRLAAPACSRPAPPRPAEAARQPGEEQDSRGWLHRGACGAGGGSGRDCIRPRLGLRLPGMLRRGKQRPGLGSGGGEADGRPPPALQRKRPSQARPILALLRTGTGAGSCHVGVGAAAGSTWCWPDRSGLGGGHLFLQLGLPVPPGWFFFFMLFKATSFPDPIGQSPRVKFPNSPGQSSIGKSACGSTPSQTIPLGFGDSPDPGRQSYVQALGLEALGFVCPRPQFHLILAKRPRQSGFAKRCQGALLHPPCCLPALPPSALHPCAGRGTSGCCCHCLPADLGTAILPYPPPQPHLHSAVGPFHSVTAALCVSLFPELGLVGRSSPRLVFLSACVEICMGERGQDGGLCLWKRDVSSFCFLVALWR